MQAYVQLFNIQSWPVHSLQSILGSLTLEIVLRVGRA